MSTPRYDTVHHSHTDQKLDFNVEGQFLGFAPDAKGKLKYLRLQTVAGTLLLKVPKEMRASLFYDLQPGEWLRVVGEQRLGDEPKWRVHNVFSIHALTNLPTLPPVLTPPCTVLVCQKSNCQRRGGKAIFQALEAWSQEHPDRPPITVQGVGCLKNCKAGPNVVIMPDNARYSGVSAENLTILLDRHLPCSPQPPK